MTLWGIDFGTATSIAALTVALASFALALSVHRRQIRAELPLVTAELSPHALGWWRLDVTVMNRSAVPWRIERARVTKPREGKIIRQSSLRRPNAARPWQVDTLPLPEPETVTRDIEIRVSLQPAGTEGDPLIVGSRDRHSEALLVFLTRSTSSRRRAISISLILRSNAADRRSTTIAITRTLTEAKSIAT